MVEPLICIIVLNWNGYTTTRECLLSLIKISYLYYTIILVDNGSTDDSIEKLSKEFTQIDYLTLNKNYGFAGGVNKGIAHAIKLYDPEFFLLLNNDTIVNTDFLSQLIRPFYFEEKVLASVPKIYSFDRKEIIDSAGGKISKLTGIVTEYGKNKNDSYYKAVKGATGFMSGCAALLSKETITKIGFFDETFFAYSEDTDYSIRILNSGYKIMFVPESMVYHKGGHSFSSNNQNWFKYYLATRNFILLQNKHSDRTAFPVFIFVFFFRWVLYLSFKMAFLFEFKSVKAIALGFIDGLSRKSRYGLEFPKLG
ncbi:MAG: glycosyltransferase family 2 protein [Bacteroidota bacterium]